MTTITLSAAGPSPQDVSVSRGSKINFVNNIGAEVILTLDNAGVFNPSQGTSLTVPTTGLTNLTVGNTSSGYSYPEPVKRAPRNGSINVD